MAHEGSTNTTNLYVYEASKPYERFYIDGQGSNFGSRSYAVDNLSFASGDKSILVICKCLCLMEVLTSLTQVRKILTYIGTT